MLGYASLKNDKYINPLILTDARGQITRLQYDGNGNLIKKINALGQEVSYQHDGEDRPIAATDALGHVSRIEYDAAGQAVKLTDPLQNAARLEYDAAGNLQNLFDALGNQVASYSYDKRDNLTAARDAFGHGPDYVYDELDRLVRKTAPARQTPASSGDGTRYAYDALARLIQAETGQAKQDYDYDPAGNLLRAQSGTQSRSSDSSAAQTEYRYDALGRLVSSLDALAQESAQSFDADGNRTTLSDPNGNLTRFNFDRSGRLTESQTAAGGAQKYTYNARDLLAQSANGRGQTHEYQYDAAGRIIKITTPEGATDYAYDANGNVLTVTDASGAITREYDALNRVTRYTDARGNHIGYEYDAAGNLITLAYPDGKHVYYQYDAANHLVKVTDWASRETVYSYDANGRLIETLRPNGTKQSRVYDAKGQLLSQTDSNTSGQIIVRFDYTYDAAGDIVEEKRTPAPQPVLPQPAWMTYTLANYLETYNPSAGSGTGQSTQFDADGNMTHGPLNGQAAEFVYDSRNRLIQAGNTQYRYDAENHRIGLNSTKFVINPQAALSQVLVKEEGGNKTFYVYGLGLIGEESVAGYKAYHFDYRGSTVALSDAAGAVAERFQYGPYGELLSGDASLTPFLFVGQYGVMRDANGLYHMRARFYSAEIRRFLNQDTLLGSVANGQGLNRFAYVNGGPVGYVDPEGLYAIVIIDSKGAAGKGHAAILIQNRTTQSWDYYSWGPIGGNLSTQLITPFWFWPIEGKLIHETYTQEQVKYNLDINYDSFLVIETTETEENNINKYLSSYLGRYYNILFQNCGDVVEDALSVGIEELSFLPGYFDERATPNDLIDRIGYAILYYQIGAGRETWITTRENIMFQK